MASPTKQTVGGFSRFLNFIAGNDSDGEDEFGPTVEVCSYVDVEAGVTLPLDVQTSPRGSRSSSTGSRTSEGESGTDSLEDNVIAKVSRQSGKIPTPLEPRGNRFGPTVKPAAKETEDVFELKERLSFQQNAIDECSRKILQFEAERKAALEEQKKKELALHQLLLRLKEDVPLTAESGPLRATLLELASLIPVPQVVSSQTPTLNKDNVVFGTTAFHIYLLDQIDQLQALLSQFSPASEQLHAECKKLLQDLIQEPENHATIDRVNCMQNLEMLQSELVKMTKFMEKISPMSSKEISRLSLELKKPKELKDRSKVSEYYGNIAEGMNSLVLDIFKLKARLEIIHLTLNNFHEICLKFNFNRTLFTNIHTLQTNVKNLLNHPEKNQNPEALQQEAEQQSVIFGEFSLLFSGLALPSKEAFVKLKLLIKRASEMYYDMEFASNAPPMLHPETKQVMHVEPRENQTILEMIEFNGTLNEELYSPLNFLFASFYNHVVHSVYSMRSMLDLINSGLKIQHPLNQFHKNLSELLLQLRSVDAPSVKKDDALSQEPPVDARTVYSRLSVAVSELRQPVMDRLKALREKAELDEQHLLIDDDLHSLPSLNQIIDQCNKSLEPDEKDESQKIIETWLAINFLLFDIKQEIALKEFKDYDAKLQSFIESCDTNLETSKSLVQSVSSCIQKLDSREGFTEAEQGLIRGFLASLETLKSPFSELTVSSNELQGNLKEKIESLSSFMILRLQENSEDIKRFGIDPADSATLTKVTEGLQNRLQEAFTRKKEVVQHLTDRLNAALCKFWQFQDNIEFSRLSITTPVEIKNLKTSFTLLQRDADALITEGNKAAADQIKSRAADISKKYTELCVKMDEYKQFFDAYARFCNSTTWIDKLHERSSALVRNDSVPNNKAANELERHQSQMVSKLQVNHRELTDVWNAVSGLKKILDPKIKTIKTASETGAFPRSWFGQ